MKLTFCINTSKNEKHYVELLFQSLHQNLSRKDHDILVFIDSDNQKTRDFLLTQKNHFPNLKIIRNPLPIPIGYARNINLMFEMAQTEVVSYLQSDMVVCKDYDLEIVKYLDENTIISATRIEPPLHPSSLEKITHDWGLDPSRFDLTSFTDWANTQKKDHIIEYWFAPFTLYKKNWIKIGGHDTLFRKSREDSDLLYRFSLIGVKTIQTWNALVYHFTCTSSRGIEWWKQENSSRCELQKIADAIEMARFSRKWPAFKHSSDYNPTLEYKYHVYLNLTNVKLNHLSEIANNYFRFQQIYIDNENVRKLAKEKYNDSHDVANYLLNISKDQWNLYKKYYRTWEPSDIFADAPFDSQNIILNIDMNTTNIFNSQNLLQLNDIIHQTKLYSGVGSYEFCNGILTINEFSDKIRENIVVENPPIDDIHFDIL
jgi:GT2 family glycosyltransferase